MSAGKHWKKKGNIMLMSLFWVVLLSSIVVFFASEWSDFFKKIFAIPGAKLLLPLIGFTTLIIAYKPWVVWGLIHLQANLQVFVTKLAKWLSFIPDNLLLVQIFVLMALTLLPMLAINTALERKKYISFKYTYIVGIAIWILVASLLVVKIN